jgi:3-methyladenine DNA glycosylase AlkD
MTSSIEVLIHRVQQTQHGFTDIKKAADEVVAGYPATECLRLAEELFQSDIPQARMLATFILGRFAAAAAEWLSFLKTRVSRDPNWRVQEILAQAFDQYCADLGYEAALPTIKEWLADPHPNVRRAVTEGLRIWTSRPYFREQPQRAIELLSQLKDDDSDYVRKSVGNALRDISHKHAELLRAEVAMWNLSNKKIGQTYKLASKFL